MKHLGGWIFLGLMILVFGCGSNLNATKSGGVQLEPQPAAPLPPGPPPEPGSIWNTRSRHGFLTDHRATDIGDIITIVIQESSKASEIANTKADRTSGVKAGVSSLFGLSWPFKAFSDQSVSADTMVEGTVGNVSKGEGKTERQSEFTAYIAAQVIQVLPNNNLVVRGHRNIKINNETQIMTLTGIVRPEDINRENQVASSQVAQARLEITGIGVIADKQRAAWFTRLLDHIWPW
ncbi:MAG: flagellar basal body L-ring protein FlgH [Desulfobacca sp.]|nr:flagellar basal body L-ring protein FlgH [Desulfobacca sp.]